MSLRVICCGFLIAGQVAVSTAFDNFEDGLDTAPWIFRSHARNASTAPSCALNAFHKDTTHQSMRTLGVFPGTWVGLDATSYYNGFTIFPFPQGKVIACVKKDECMAIGYFLPNNDMAQSIGFLRSYMTTPPKESTLYVSDPPLEHPTFQNWCHEQDVTVRQISSLCFTLTLDGDIHPHPLPKDQTYVDVYAMYIKQHALDSTQPLVKG